MEATARASRDVAGARSSARQGGCGGSFPALAGANASSRFVVGVFHALASARPQALSRTCGGLARVDHRSRESGQSLAEYALIVALIVIVALVALTLFGTQINDILSMIANQING